MRAQSKLFHLTCKAFDFCLKGDPTLLVYILRSPRYEFDQQSIALHFECAAKRAAEAKKGGKPPDLGIWMAVLVARALLDEWKFANEDEGLSSRGHMEEMRRRCCQHAIDNHSLGEPPDLNAVIDRMRRERGAPAELLFDEGLMVGRPGEI